MGSLAIPIPLNDQIDAVRGISGNKSGLLTVCFGQREHAPADGSSFSTCGSNGAFVRVKMDFSRNPSAKLSHRDRLALFVLEDGSGILAVRKAFLQGGPLVVGLQACDLERMGNGQFVLIKRLLRVGNELNQAQSSAYAGDLPTREATIWPPPSLLFAIAPTDAATFASVTVVLAVVALAACYVSCEL